MNTSIGLLRRVGLAVLALSTAVPVFAQTAGSLRGTVTDRSGGVLQGASVALTNEATKFSRQVTTDAKGGYFFAGVEPGNHTLKVQFAGFTTREIRGLHVSPNDTLGVDVTLDVGTPTETIDVSAARDFIPTQTGAREGLVTAEQIENISMIGRNPIELMRLLPGMVTPDQSTMEVVGKFNGASNTGGTTPNGIRGANIMVSLDGAKLQDSGANNGTLIVPNNDMVSEVKVQTSNYSAEFGSAGVNIQAVTKSGGSELHGTVYDYVRDYRLAANDRSRSSTGGERPKSKFQYPGFNLSGPIVIPGTGLNKKRDKLFFFIGAEISRQTLDQGSTLSITPTPGQRQGLFNDYIGGQNLNQPTTVNIPYGFPGAGTPASNNDLRPYMTETGRKLLNLWPMPNYDDPTNRYNYIFSQLAKADRDQEVVRVDYNISDNTRAYVRLARDNDKATRPLGLWWNSSQVELPTPVESTSLGRAVSGNVTSILSPSTTNEVIFSWSQLKNDNRWQDPSKVQLATYGIADFMNPFGASPFIPQMVMQNNGGNLWSMGDVENIFSYNSFVTVADNFTKVLDTHAVKVGVLAERWQKQQNFNNTANAQLNFNNNAPGSTGLNFGDVLTGRFTQAVIGTPSAVGDFVGWSFEGYVQDSWKVNRSFTLEYGLRFAKWTNNEETNGLGSIFQPSRYDPTKGLFLDADKRRVNGLAYAQTGDVSRALTEARPLQLMPRVNFSWDVNANGNTIVRGGAGVFYNREQGNAQFGVINLPPNAYAATLNASSLTGLAGGRGLTYSTLGLVDPYASLNGFNINSVDPDSLDWPRTITASLSVAHRLPWKQVVDVGYVGSFGRNLAEQRNFNVIQPGRLLSGTIGNSDLSVPVNRVALDASVVNNQRPFPTMQNITYFTQSGVSDYHSLQATLSRQTGRFQYLLSYTFSKSLGTLGGDLAAIDPLDARNRSYGVLATDRTHVANLSWSWDVGDPVKGNVVARALVNGWHLSGISSFASGQPLRLVFGGDINGGNVGQGWWGTPDYVNPVFPVYTCDPRKSGSKLNEFVADINCIGIPALGETGPLVQPYYLRAPSISNHDLTVFKNFALDGSGRKLQVRVGAFNIFNQAFPSPTLNAGDIDVNLITTCNVRVNGVPNGMGGTQDGICDPARGFSFTSQTVQNFGKIVTQRGHRVIELALKLYF